jgi:hypothetical protein
MGEEPTNVVKASPRHEPKKEQRPSVNWAGVVRRTFTVDVLA